MAEHLLEQGYKDASAVITGSTLENHLRKMCLKNNINLEQTNSKGKTSPKKADLLNSELCKSSVYNVSTTAAYNFLILRQLCCQSCITPKSVCS